MQVIRETVSAPGCVTSVFHPPQPPTPTPYTPPHPYKKDILFFLLEETDPSASVVVLAAVHPKVRLVYLPLVSREWKNGSNSSYNCAPFLHSLLTKGKSGLGVLQRPCQCGFLIITPLAP